MSSFANGWATSGGGVGDDFGNAIAVQGANVFVTGSFVSNNAAIAGQALTGPGGRDLFVAKYTDTSTGGTAATSSFINGWALADGGTSSDYGQGLAVQGTGIFVTGSFTSGSNAHIAGQALTGSGTNNPDVFVAKYIDTSTGSTPATSSFANGWATSGGSPGALGTNVEGGQAIAVQGTSIFVTGYFSSNNNANIAGQSLTGAGATDVFVAKYIDTSTGSTPATSSFANGWATSGGGTATDQGFGIAVRGTNVFVAGTFTSNGGITTNAAFAGQSLIGAGRADAFVAKYIDTSTGSTPATSSFANGWATSGGSSSIDFGYGIAMSGQQVYVVGNVVPPATFAPFAIGMPGTDRTAFLAGLTDPTLTPLAAAPAATPVATGFTLSPNPARTACTVQGAPAGAALEVFDALGRAVAAGTANATGTARLALPAGLPPGVYVVRGGGLARRLAVE